MLGAGSIEREGKEKIEEVCKIFKLFVNRYL